MLTNYFKTQKQSNFLSYHISVVMRSRPESRNDRIDLKIEFFLFVGKLLIIINLNLNDVGRLSSFL
jgi:hypothetical protein